VDDLSVYIVAFKEFRIKSSNNPLVIPKILPSTPNITVSLFDYYFVMIIFNIKSSFPSKKLYKFMLHYSIYPDID
jgi:hypothetical protein